MHRITADAPRERLSPTTLAYLRITRARFPAPRFIADELLSALDDSDHSVGSNVYLLLGKVLPTTEREWMVAVADDDPEIK
jgi:hypothetical protein